MLASPAREVFEATLELVTPAFLAGAQQEADDCQLRSATLRGLLRWWWRTMHAGFVDVATLRRLETAVWGDARTGSASASSSSRRPRSNPSFSTTRNAFHPSPISNGAISFSRRRTRRRPKDCSTPPTAWTTASTSATTCTPGTRWTVRLVARRSYWETRDSQGKPVRNPISPAVILQQAKAALWLLTHLGGVGSKSRKGFGSLADVLPAT